MKKILQITSLLLAILTVLPVLPIFASENAEQTTAQPITEGLVSYFDGANNTEEGHDSDTTVWSDLAGDNDITLTLSDTTYFTDNALHLSSEQFNFPDELLQVVNGSEFTVELTLGKIASYGSSFTTFINSQNDNFALFLRTDGDYIEFKNGANGRPKVPNGKSYAENSTVAITFSLSEGACVLYTGGHEIGRVAITSKIEANSPLFFGHSVENRVHTADYRGFRFYDRALSAEEIKQNAKADGTYDENVVPTKTFIKTEQPSLGVIGDLALVEYVKSDADISALIAADTKPASAIYYLNEELALTTPDGTVLEGYDLTYVLENIYNVVPVFYLKSGAAAEALASVCKSVGFCDYAVMSSDPQVVKAARTAHTVCRGMLDLSKTFEGRTDLTDRELSDIRRLAYSSLAHTVLLPQGVASKEDIEQLNGYQVNPWILANEGLEDTVPALTLLLSGAHGIVSDNTALLVDTATSLLENNTLLRAPLNVGHRGTYASIANAPENTLENALVAYENGANALEIDVFMTKDGVIVLHHDSGTGTGKMKNPEGSSSNWSIENNNWSFLSTLYYTGYYETEEDGSYKLDEEGNKIEYTGFHLSTLDSLLEEFKGKDVELVIEIKSSKEAIVPALKRLIDRYDMYDQCMIIAFPSFGLQDDLATYFPEMPVGSLLSTSPSTDSEQAVYYTSKEFLPVNALPDVNYSGYGASYLRACRYRGISAMGWTINATASIYKGILDGLSGITTDNCHVIGTLAKSVTASTPYWVKPGSTLTVSAEVTAYNRTTIKEGAFLEIVDGNELIASTNGMTLTLKDGVSGSVTYIVGYTQTLDSTGAYTVYCQPVTVYVSQEEQTAPEPEQITEPSLLTLLDSGKGFYNETDENDVCALLEFTITNKDGSSAADLFENKESYLWKMTINGKDYTVAPTSYDNATGQFTFVLNGKDGFVPTKNTLYTISLALYSEDTLTYRTVNNLSIRTPADFLHAHTHNWSSIMSYAVRPSTHETGIGYYPCTVCGTRSASIVLPKVEYVIGDVNLDGRVSISDVTAQLNFLSLSEMDKKYAIKTGAVHEAELNFDNDDKGIMAVSDVTALLSYLSGQKIAVPEIEQNGLVAWYDGTEHTDTVWTDKAGNNDINVTAGSFENGALVLENQQVTIPSAVYDAVRGSEYTIEINLGAFSTVYATTGYCTWLCNSGTEKVSLFITNSDGAFAAKISDQTSGGRPSLANAVKEMQNATIAVTYKTNGKAILYVNGVAVSSKNTSATNGNSKAAAGSTFILGNTASNKLNTTEFQGLRFYDRALTADEVAANAAHDRKYSFKASTVKDGLVAWYDGEIYDGSTWVDLMGNNDLQAESGSFEEGAYHLAEGEEQKLPREIIPALQGEDYTIEIDLGAFEATGTNYTTWLYNLPGGNSEVLSLYIQNGTTNTFYGKVSGLARGARPLIAKASGALQDATITITYQTGGSAILYVNGRKISTMSAATSLKHGNITDLVLGAAAASNSGDTYFEGLRIYNKALSAAEVRRNVAANED